MGRRSPELHLFPIVAEGCPEYCLDKPVRSSLSDRSRGEASGMTPRFASHHMAAALVATALMAVAPPLAKAEDVTLNVWTHEADEDAKVAFRELAARNLEKAHPGVKVKITWYEKNPL